MENEEPVNKVEVIHEKLESMMGERVKVRANMGRSRIVAREGISEEYAQLRIGAQQPDSYYTERCTAVLVNDKSKEDFAKLCESEFRKEI